MIRVFSEAKKEELYRVLDMIDDKGWEPFGVWSGRRGYEFGEWANKLGVYHYMRQTEYFQNKILTLNSITRKQIEANFEGVEETDRRYAEIFRENAESVKRQIGVVEQMIEFFNPYVTFHTILHEHIKWGIVDSKRKFSEIQATTEPDSGYDEFIYSVGIAYGFDEMTAQTLGKIYRKFETKYEDNAAQVFFAVMASFSYGEVEDKKQAILWQIIAAIPQIQSLGYEFFEQYGITEKEYDHVKSQILIQHLLCGKPQNTSVNKLIDDEELNKILNAEANKKYDFIFEELPEEIKMSFCKPYLDYCDKSDFTHMCATSATILYDGEEKGLGLFAGIFNGIYSVEGNAGYVGDVYGTNGADPSMGNADYMADLDAVNISNRVKNGKSAIEAISEYYAELENGQTNRAREFKYNIGKGDEGAGLCILIMETDKYYRYIEQLDKVDDMENRKSVVRRFINSLIYEYNYLCEE